MSLIHFFLSRQGVCLSAQFMCFFFYVSCSHLKTRCQFVFFLLLSIKSSGKYCSLQFQLLKFIFIIQSRVLEIYQRFFFVITRWVVYLLGTAVFSTYFVLLSWLYSLLLYCDCEVFVNSSGHTLARTQGQLVLFVLLLIYLRALVR